MMVGMVMFIALQSSDMSSFGGVKTMLVTALERERQQIFQSGLREGEQKGKQEGLLEGEQKGRIETAKAMLAKGMEMTLIAEITNLPEAQLLELRDGLSSTKN